MSALLTDPTVALVLCADEARCEALRTAVMQGDVTSVESYDGCDGLVERVEAASDVGCVLATDDAEQSPVSTVERIGAADPLLPVVVSAAEGDESLASATTRAGAFAYLSADAAPETLSETVDDALAAYEERRTRAEESSILRTVLEGVGTSVYAKDDAARHVRVARVPGGDSPERLRGQTDLEVYGDEDPETARETYEEDLRVIEEEAPVYDKLEHHELDSGDHWTRTTKVPWYGRDGEVKGLVGMSWDVTEYVHLEQRLHEQEERIDQFASYVSHDLRSPLQVATGALELAREGGGDEALQRVDDALARIDDIIGDLSALAKQGRASTTFHVDETSERAVGEPTRLVALVEEVWGVVQTDQADLDVAFEGDAVINASEESVRPILENLFTNAVAHAGPAVTVRVGPLPDGGFYVEDDGPGIPPQRRDKVLEPGFSTSERGTGTGLNIVSETVDRHAWSLEIGESASGGARFEIRNCLVVDQPDREFEPGPSLPLDRNEDVGTVEKAGEATYDDVVDRWTVTGAGSNIWRQDNDFHFAHAAVDGPVRIEGRVVAIDEVNDYSKAGFMVRDGLAPDATYGYVGVTPRHGTELLWRTERGADGISQHLDDEAMAYPWYRVDRIDDVVTTALSPDGEEWYPIDQRRIAADDPVYVGLVVCSFTPRRRCEATFENVSVRRLERP